MTDAATLFEYVRGYWRTAAPEQLRRGVWVSLHEPVDADASAVLAMPAQRAWWLTDRAVEARPVASFKIFADHRHAASAKDAYEFGMANVAPDPAPPVYRIDCLSAPLHSESRRVRFDAGGAVLLAQRSLG